MPKMTISTGLTETGTTQYEKLGSQFERENPVADRGPQIWVYIKNSSGTAYAIGEAVAHKDSLANYETVLLPVSGSTAGHPSRCVGFVQHAIADGAYGWVLRDGYGTVLADTGGIAANTALTTGNAVAGRIDSGAAVTTEALGWAHVAIAATATGIARVFARG